jgi:hypothetical protein
MGGNEPVEHPISPSLPARYSSLKYYQPLLRKKSQNYASPVPKTSMTNHSEQFRVFQTQLAWLFKIQFPALLQRGSNYLHATQKSNAQAPLHHTAQK